MKNGTQRENHCSSEGLERAIARFVEHTNHGRLHEATNNAMPRDLYQGRQRAFLSRRAKIKRLTFERRKKEN
jgi:hypothetical protein